VRVLDGGFVSESDVVPELVGKNVIGYVRDTEGV